MADGFYKAVAKELGNCGYWYLETKKHEVWVNGDGKKLTVPYNLRSRHTANDILEDAGSDKKL